MAVLHAMAKILTGYEVGAIMQECRARGQLSEYTEGSEYFVRIPAVLGQGWGRTIKVRPGLTLHVANLVKHQTHIHKIPHHSPSMPLTFCYYLSGGCRVDNDGLAAEVEEVAGKSYLYRLPNTGEVEEYPTSKKMCRFSVQVSTELMYDFCDRIHEFPAALRNTLEHPENARRSLHRATLTTGVLFDPHQ